MMSLVGFGQASENFENIPASNTNYLSRTWIGTNTVTWTAVRARTDQSLNTKAICTDGTGSVTSPSYANGMGTLTFKYVRAFTGTAARSIEVFVNNIKIGSTITVTANSDIIQNYSQTINLTGNVILELRTTGAQIKIDDIAWTAFAPTTPFLTLIGTVAHPSTCPAIATPAITYTITNTGTAAANVTITNNNAIDFTVSPLSSTSIGAPNGTATFTVTFNPATSGPKSASLTANFNTSTASGSIGISGIGTAVVAQSATTTTATAIAATGATLNGNNTLGTCPSSTVRGFVYAPTATNNSPQVGGAGVIVVNESSALASATFSESVSGLTPSTNYSFVAYEFNGTSYVYGAVFTFSTAVLISNLSDIFSSGGEATLISSLRNTPLISSNTDGIQVWQFLIRDGGSTLTDADTLPTIVNNITITRSPGNAIDDWADAIQSVALFSGNIKIADGVVSANQIVFSGLPLISVPDNTNVALTIRLSLQINVDNITPNTNIDGDDFGFQISQGNVTFDATGSGKATFSTTSTNGSNILDIVATALTFGNQPTDTNINEVMSPNVTIKAIDVNGNVDRDFVAAVSVTSTGNMSPANTAVNAILGVATFNTIVHTALGTGLILTASSDGFANINSGLFKISIATIFKSGDLIFVGYDGQVTGTGTGDDEFLIATMIDIIPNSSFSIVNSRYEAGAIANNRTNKWGGSGDIASDPPGVETVRYVGNNTIQAGSILKIRADNGIYDIRKIIGTTTSANVFATEFLVSNNGSTPNLSTSAPDQIYLIQGSLISDGTIDANQANYILNGTVLHGITNQTAWVPLTSLCSGGNTNTARVSRLHPALACFNVENTGLNAESAYYENDKAHGLTSKRNIINAVGDNVNNWTFSTGRYNFSPATTSATSAGKTFLISAGSPDGTWIGDKLGDNTNWFNCGNWSGLSVPDENTDVTIDTNSLSIAGVRENATFSNDFADIAKCKNLTISNQKVQITANILNKLEVHGNLIIDAGGALDMSDANVSIADGQLYLYGNWTNNADETFFKQGESTVHFVGSTPQIINNVTGTGTEIFYNVVLNNNFETNISNDLYALGNVIVSSGTTLKIASNDYVRAERQLINNGTIDIANNGSLVQVVDGLSNGNTGIFKMQRIAKLRLQDYCYWSSPIIDNVFPVKNISPLTANNHIWKWIPTGYNLNGTISSTGNWVNTIENMKAGQGYIVRGPAGSSASIIADMPATFTGTPNNGIVNTPIIRGDYDGLPYLGNNGTQITKDGDNYNLIGNPYPSAIDAKKFLTANNNIEGKILVWRHGMLPNSNVAQPFYNTYGANYDVNDYVTYNLTGASEQGGYNGNIPAGQGFMVLMLHSAPTPSNIVFSNALRLKTDNSVVNNSQFFRSSNVANTIPTEGRYWLYMKGNNLVNNTMIGYVEGATNNNDRLYDATNNSKENQNFYSTIDHNSFAIQGRNIPFSVADIVPLGFKSPTTSTYKIGIAGADGLFINDNQNIFLEDKQLNIIHNISSSEYEFTSAQGTFNNRFVLRYDNVALANPVFEKSSNVFVYQKNETIFISSENESIASIIIYDLLGRNIFEKQSINNKQIEISTIAKNNSPLFVKTTFENGKTVTTKIIF